MELSNELIQQISRILKVYGEEYVEATKQRLKDKNGIASGELYNSIEFNIDYSGQSISLLISMEDYAEFVDKGRRPGKFPPPNKIENWIREKGITPLPSPNGLTPDTKTLSYLIGRKIATEGTEGKDFIRPINIQRLIELMEEGLKETVTQDIKDELISGLTNFR